MSSGCRSSVAQLNLPDRDTASDTVATGGAAGESLVNFLRASAATRRLFIASAAIKGDIVVRRAPACVPIFNYTDAHYDEYKTAKASRAGGVHVSANDV